ncbi:hypothetical protein [Streptomyces gobiensis]|uniref:hypothetical protein n=1 Tax=Streptomyces gobiensis TaxID=2875706 RepID=UPI001E46EE5F|nr:hypothetical protein [Streptomyces gobiensis]UGY91703.1 hypothetical protein test1122_08180 [Streptomyces gobiensis]
MGPDLAARELRSALAEADEAIEVDWRRRSQLLTAMGRFVGAAQTAVFGFGEASALAASWANCALRLPGNPPPAVAALTDPVTLRGRVNHLTEAPVRFELCDRAALAKAACQVGFPCVVKPRAGGCRRRDRIAVGGVHTLHSALDAEALAERLPPQAELLVEEYLSGPRYSVEAHSYFGAHTIMGVTPRDPDGHGGLDEHTAPQVHRLVTDTLDAADYWTGPSQTTVIVTARGPRLVSSRPCPGRDSGSGLYELTIAAVLDLPQPAHHARAG